MGAVGDHISRQVAGRRGDFSRAAGLFLLHLVLTGPWIYSGGGGEPDSIAMISGVFQALLKGTYFGETLYMLMGQPLYYGLFFAIPGGKFLSYDQLALVMNVVSWFASAGSSVLVYRITRRFVSPAAALLPALLCLSSPTIFEWSTYAHPVTVSLFLVLLAVDLFLLGLKRAATGVGGAGERFRETGFFGAAAALAGAGMLVRADVIILFHMFPLLGWVQGTQMVGPGRGRWKPGAAGAVVGLAAALIGFVGLAPFAPAREGTDGSSASALLQTVRGFFRLMPPVDGVLELAFGIGVVGSVLGAVAGAVAVARKSWGNVAIGLLLLLPPLVFAMGNPQPARRFLHATYAGLVALALLWRAVPPSWHRFAPAVGAGAILGNLLFLPAFGRLLTAAGYPLRDHSLVLRATASVFDHHRVNQAYLAWIEERMRGVRRGASDGGLLTGAFAHVNFLMASLSRERLPAETRIVQRGAGYFVTRVTAPGGSWDVCEFFPTETSITLQRTYSRVFQFTSSDPRDLGTTAPIERHVVRPGGEFQMWYRGNASP